MVSFGHPKIATKTLLAVIYMLFAFIYATPNPLESQTTTCFSKTPDSDTHSNILSDVTQAIGETPLVDLSRIAKHYGIEDAKILAKLEYLSPGGSKKDRIALSIIQHARRTGSLKPGQTVVELTSGNTGTGLAIVCGIFGHPFVAVMSKGNSRERSQMMEALGATVVLVDTVDSSKGKGVSGADLDLVEEKAQEIANDLQAFRVDQFVKEANALAHYEHTGPELWRDSGGSITHFLDFVGTGGSFGGIARYLKEQSNGAIYCYVVEPEGAVVLGNSTSKCFSSGCHRIQGGGYMKSKDELPLMAPTGQEADNPWIDGYLTVTDEEAIQATRDLAKCEGIFAGYSAGANLMAAIKLLRQENKKQQRENKKQIPSVVAILICDTGLKYMSTGLWE